MSTTAARLCALWDVHAPAEVARVERLAERVAAVLPPEVLAPLPGELDPAVEALLAEGEAGVSRWVREVEAPATPDERRGLLLEALAAWGERHGMHGDIAALANRLVKRADSDEVVRHAAFRALARARPAPLVAEWLKGLGDADPKVRVGAATLLGLSRDPAALRPLARLVAEGDVEVVQTALWAIGEIGAEDAVVQSVLADAVAAHFCPGPAIDALGRMGDADAVKTLLQALGRNEPLRVLAAVARVVERHLPFDVPAAVLKLHVGRLRPLLAHDEPGVRVLAGVTLVRLGHTLSQEDLGRLLAT